MAHPRTKADRATEWLVAAGAGFLLGALAMALVTVDPRAVLSAGGSADEAIANLEAERPIAAGQIPAIDDPADGPARRVAPPRVEAAGSVRAPRLVLRIPVRGVTADALVASFDDPRGRGRVHEAIDIPAPRHTPVVAVGEGTVAKLFTSDAGGLTVYQYGPDGRHVYYYAHLQGYADGLAEGQRLRGGDVIGFVGTSGNAPPDVPHLHFAIMRIAGEGRWWDGEAIDPYPLFDGSPRDRADSRQP